MTRATQAGILAASCLGAALLATAPWPAKSVHAAARATTGDPLVYASPVETLFSPDGARLYVLCQQGNQVRVLDAATYKLVATIAVGRVPRGFALSHDGSRLYVANSWDDTLSVIDAQSLQLIATWPVSAEPSSVAADLAGNYLFVANRISNDVAVLDARTGAELKRLAAGRGASYITLSPDGRRLYVTHVYPNLPHHASNGGNRIPPESEITVVDTSRAVVADRIPLHSIAGVFHVAISSDGRLGAVAELHPKNLIPLAHLEHGFAFADTLTLFGADIGPMPIEIPIDELERYAARPFGIAISPDKSRLYVTSGGSEIVTVIDLRHLLATARARRKSFVEDLSASANYVVTRIDVGRDPRGATLSPDGRRLFVANRLDDTISVIDTYANGVIATIPLDGAKEISVLRHGEQTFYTARYSFQGQIGCANCHIDSTFDGLTWDLEPDGFGVDVVENKLLEGVKDVGPYKWNGANPNLPTECGPRTEKYFWRSENFDDLTLTDLVTYIRSLEPRPNRWHSSGNELTAAQERGKEVFERTLDNFGKPIPEANRCSYCHSGPNGTDRKNSDVGTKKSTDRSGLLKTPQLTDIGLMAPYLHDGSAPSLEEIWTVFNPSDKHGRTNDLNKTQLNDLIEYLRTR